MREWYESDSSVMIITRGDLAATAGPPGSRAGEWYESDSNVTQASRQRHTEPLNQDQVTDLSRQFALHCRETGR